jgi:hypothetical protein
MRSRSLLAGVVTSIAVLALTLSVAQPVEAAARGAHRVPVLGAKKFAGRYGEGWGHAHPKALFNGGDPSGYISGIVWHRWGKKRAYGWGKNAIFRPRGGYYRHPVRIELRAQNLGKCGNRPAYTHLWVREPSKPGGKLGKWHSWSYNNTTLCKFGF